MTRKIVCPECQSDSVGTIEKVFVIASLSGINDDKTLEWDGFVENEYDESETQRDAHGRIIIQCMACRHEFSLTEDINEW